MNNVKEIIKIGVLLFLVVFFVIFFNVSKGDDKLDLNFEFKTQEDFSYPVASSEYNGLYYNTKDNGYYVMVGKNEDNTYRVYVIDADPLVQTVLKVDAATMKDNKITFVDTTNASVENLKMVIKYNSAKEMSIEPEMMGFSNAKIDGHYTKVKSINQFTLDEFEYQK